MKPLRIHCFQHVDYEDLGCIKDWCKAKGHLITYTKFYKREPLPHVTDFEWLIIMGGPMGVHDDKTYSWLTKEKKAIEEAIDHNNKVIGICLGSQLIAEVLGARVYKNPNKEIGWFDVMLTEQGKSEPLTTGIRAISKVFHWHGDTFDLPKSSKHIFFSEACRNQAFIYRDIALGLQFHFEVTEKNIATMMEKGKHELTGEKYIQSEKEILTHNNNIESGNISMFQILDNLAENKACNGTYTKPEPE